MSTKRSYSEFKKEAIQNYPLFKTVPAGNLNYVDNDVLECDGLQMSFSQAAVNKMGRILKIPALGPNAFAKLESKELRLGLKNEILKDYGKDKSITLLANRIQGRVTQVLEKEIVSPDAYFDNFERIMNSDKFSIKEMNFDEYGLPSISVVGDKTLNFNNSAAEDFNTGLTFAHNNEGDLSLMSYLFRIICSNGMIAKDLENDFVFDSNDFYNKIVSLKNNNYISPKLNDYFLRAMTNKASLQEVKDAGKLILNRTLQGINYSEIEQWNQYEKLNKVYRDRYNVGGFNEMQRKQILTDVSLWDLVNGITDFASHDYGYKVNRTDLQIEAYGFLMRNKIDALNVLPTPFQLN